MAEKIQKKQSANLSQIAEAAGVSKMTVSRVLRNVDGFSETTRQKVLREVEKQGYLPNRLASTFGTAQSSTLMGVCVPQLSNHLVMQALEAMDRTFERLGYQIIIGCHNNQPAEEEAWLKSILSWRPAGVLLSSKYHSEGSLRLLKDADIPVLEFWDLNTSPVALSVGFNEYDSGFEMGQYAIMKGYKRAALLIAHPDNDAVAPERFAGFKRSFIEGNGEIVHTEILKDQPSFYAGYYGTENVLNHTQNVDLIYCLDDAMAIGGLAWCERKGIRVPHDIGIAGWGGHEAASVLPQRLTTTAVPVLKMGKLAAAKMLQQLNDEPTDSVSAVQAKLVKGDTL